MWGVVYKDLNKSKFVKLFNIDEKDKNNYLKNNRKVGEKDKEDDVERITINDF